MNSAAPAVPGSTPFVTLNLTHNLTVSRIPEIRFELSSTIGQVKEQIEKRYGTSSDQMELILQDASGNNICNLGDDNKALGYYSPLDSYNIYVIDKDPHSLLKDIDDVSQVDKYTISEEDYDKLSNNFRKFKQKFIDENPDPKQGETVIIVEDDYLKEEADAIKIGDRCEFIETKKRGTIQYVGRIPNLGTGYYVGIQLDEPHGKNNGSFGEVQYFTCSDKYGIFTRPDRINIGDYPELDLDDIINDEDEI